MGAVALLARGSLRRRRLQGLIVGAVLLLATLASTMALDILVGSRAPFDTAFDSANGAHLVLTMDGALASTAQLTATAGAPGVTAAAGPWPIARAGFLANPGDVDKGAPSAFAPGVVAGRPSPDGAVDRLTTIDGRWWQAPGEVVLSRAEAALAAAAGVHLGDTIDLAILGGPAAPGVPPSGAPPTVALRVVGVAVSISTPDVRAWMSPVDVARFLPADAGPQMQMLYRVADPSTQAALAALRDAIAASLPQGAVVDTTTWLGLRSGADLTASLMVPILLAFAAFALLAAAFIVVNVVSGVVIGSTRQIGLMKAVGATPRQVTTVLLVEILVPAAMGIVAGILIGAAASRPILGDSAAALGVTELAAVSPVVLAGVGLVAIGVTFLAALVPAIRGGRLRATEALARGSIPSGSGRRTARSRFGPTWLPSPIGLGLGRIAARPLRTAMTLGALIVGVSALSFTVGMESSLRHVGVGLFRDHAAPVRVDIPREPQALGGALKTGPGAAPTPMAPEDVDAVIRAQPGVARAVAIGEADVTMNGWANAIPFFAYRDDATWIGYVVIDGRWFSAPGEVVVPENFLTQTGTHIGDRITVYTAAQPVTLTIVGSIFDTFRCHCDGPPNIVIRGGWQTLAAADPTLSPTSWEVATNDLMSPAAVAQQIRQTTSGFADASPASSAGTDEGFLLFQGVIASLGVILVLVALGGVINTVLLESRERLRETAILRAVGMTPRQVTAMVVATVVPLGAIAALVGIPVGQLLQRAVIEDMGRIAIASSVPGSLTSATTLAEFALVALGGLAIAFVGAWLPARRTATLPIAPVLAAE